MSRLVVNKVAVLGAGVMGAQIAAHFANCQHEVLLYDLPGRSAVALKSLLKLKPSPVATQAMLERIQACDYDNNLNDLTSCDWVVEAVAEDMAIKTSLYSKVKPYINDKALFTTNTSGLSVNNLAEILEDKNLAKRFFGTHFFNPPRYQKLVELIPHQYSDSKLIDGAEQYFTRFLGKGIIRAKDTPNFIANRIGVFSMLATMHHAYHYQLGFDVVDALTGELIGRPKSGTFRTADVVGLDTLVNVINTMRDNCKADPWHSILNSPGYLLELVSKGHLGQKSQKGFYYKDGNDIKVLDFTRQEYILADTKGSKLDPKLLEILKIKSVVEKFKALKQYDHPQAQFLWSCFRDVWHYSAWHLIEIADTVRDIDEALKWGFGWQQGPFELWQAIGVQELGSLITDEINSGKALSFEQLPDWIANTIEFYRLEDGSHLSYSPISQTYKVRSDLEVYKRQISSATDINSHSGFTSQNILLENDSAKLWAYDNKAIFSLKTKMNTIDTLSIELLNEAIDYISNSDQYNSLTIWQDKGPHFSAGADLKGFVASFENGDYTHMEEALCLFQIVCQKMRYADFPVVAAVKGLAIGGGCELLLHCDRVVASHESYIGLVEVGVGVVPSGGGLKEMVLRANQYYDSLLRKKLVTSPDKLLEDYYKNIATAAMSTSAYDAVDKGYLRDSDIIIANDAELLYVALQAAESMAQLNYRPPVQQQVKVSGGRLKANLQSLLANFLAGGFISQHDHLIASKIANVFSGGDVDLDSYVTEEWLLRLEREAFISLLKTSQTQERINHMLKKGKPLRN